MSKFVVATVSEIPPGQRKLIWVRGRQILRAEPALLKNLSRANELVGTGVQTLIKCFFDRLF